MKRNLSLREYQQEPAKFALNTDIAVLALAPNSGKSEISIYVIDEYLRKNKGAKVLFMPHSTNVLLDNIVDRMDGLNVGFTYSKNLDDDVQVHISLPQSEKDLQNNKYDFIIVDEAHENYHAARMQRIIKSCQPTKQLLLTGTPENFIRKGGYNIYCLAANDIAEEWFAKLNIELVASNYKWCGHYNNDQNVQGDFKYYKKDTEKTLENVVMSLLQRVKGDLTADEFNKIKILPKITSWFKVSKKIGKTLITCRRTDQADQIYNILKKQGVNVGVSHSKSDLDSQEIAKFKDGEYDIMVVVNRARLGYSDDNLMNVIDMSGTHNPSLIYQTFSRASRGTPEQQKYYLKVTPQGEGQMDLTHMSVCAALMLTDKRYLSTYNGSNFNGIVIPVKKQKRNSSGKGGGSSKKKKEKVVFPDFSNDVIDLFKNIIANMDKSASIYKSTTIREVRGMMGERVHMYSGYWTFERCKKEALKFTQRRVFKINSVAYSIAQRNNWLENVCEHMVSPQKESGFWDLCMCKKEALKFKTRGEFARKSGSAYSSAQRQGWLDNICEHMTSQREYWDFEKCKKKALKYNDKQEFITKEPRAYAAIKYNKWGEKIDEYAKWPILDYDSCKKESSKYLLKSTFKKESRDYYNKIIKEGWDKDLLSHMGNTKWGNYEICKKESKKFKSRTDFQKSGAYWKARSMGWLDEFFPKKNNKNK